MKANSGQSKIENRKSKILWKRGAASSLALNPQLSALNWLWERSSPDREADLAGENSSTGPLVQRDTSWVRNGAAKSQQLGRRGEEGDN